MKKLIFLSFLLIGSFLSADNKEQYLKLLNSNRLPELYEHLLTWEKEAPEDAELIIAFFNYYLRKGYAPGLAFKSRLDRKAESALAITDPVTGEILCYLADNPGYIEDDLRKAFEYINRGLVLYPDRLDMHFGRIHLLGQIGDYESQGKGVASVLDLSRENSNNWKWSDGERLPAGEDFMLNTMQDYIQNWFQSGTAAGMEAARFIGEREISLYPDQVFGYNNLALYYALDRRYKEALEIFKKGEERFPEDCIVLLNIAYTYLQLGEKLSAKEYLNKVIKTEDAEYINTARRLLSNLGE